MPTTKYKDRPTCETPGCHGDAAMVRDYYDGWANYRKWCSSCHNKRTAEKHGLKSIAEVVAKKQGLTLTEYINRCHPSRRYRKSYCENQDGRLGYACTTTVIWDGMLDVDHINGNPSDDREENCQTLCKCCHAYKTSIFRDWATPGRSELGIYR